MNIRPTEEFFGTLSYLMFALQTIVTSTGEFGENGQKRAKLIMIQAILDYLNEEIEKMENSNKETFNRKLFTDHLLITFVILGIFWGLCIILGINGITMENHAWIYFPYLLGGISPTIASFVALKKNEKVAGFKDWLRHVFDFKHGIWSYLLVILFPILQMILMCLIGGYEKGLPIYLILLMIPVMILGGGLEEAGWRYVTFPELSKRFGLVISVLITAIIWWLWHLPLFFIPGAGQYHKNFFVFGIMVLGLSFMLATIRYLTGSVWLCVLCHSIVNSLSNFFIYDFYGSYVASSVTMLIMIAVSITLLYASKKKNIFK